MNILTEKYLKSHFKDNRFSIGHIYWDSMRLSGEYFIGSEKYIDDQKQLIILKYQGTTSGNLWNGEKWNFHFIDEEMESFSVVFLDLENTKFYESQTKIRPKYINKIMADSIIMYNPMSKTIQLEEYKYDELKMMEIRMDRAFNISTNSEIFRDTLTNWFEERGELLLLIRYPARGGLYDFELHQDLNLLKKRLDTLESCCQITIIKDFYLPIRGEVNKDLISKALKYIKDNEEFIILGLECEDSDKGIKPEFCRGENHNELIELLNEFLNKQIALGKDKNATWMKDNVEELTAYIPIENGDIITTAY